MLRLKAGNISSVASPFESLLTSFNIKYGFAFANKNKFLTDENRMCSPKFLNEYAFFYDKMRLELFPQACKK